MFKNSTWQPKLSVIAEDNQQFRNTATSNAKVMFFGPSKNESTEQPHRFYTIEQIEALEKAYDEQTKSAK